MKKFLLGWGMIFFSLPNPLYAQKQFVFAFFSPEAGVLSSQNRLNDFSDRFLDVYQNKVALAGVLEDGSWFYMLDSPSSQKAREWIVPLSNTEVKSFTIELFPGIVRAGIPCSDNPDKEGNYTFVRFDSHITKFNVRNAPQLFKIHDDHLKKIKNTGNVVMEALFANDDGGIMILHGGLEREVVYSDPAVINGFLEPEIHKMKLISSSFCGR